MSFKFKIAISVIFAILITMSYGYTVPPRKVDEKETKVRSVEMATELAEISATFVYNLDVIQLRASLSPILKKNQMIQGLTIADSLTGEKLFTYYRDENKPYYEEELPSHILELMSAEANIVFNGAFVGKIKIYVKNVERERALLSSINSDFEYKIRFLIGLFILLSITSYLAYNTLFSKKNLEDNPLSFGTTKFAVIVLITMTIFITLSIAGGWFIVDHNKQSVKDRVETSLHQTLKSITTNINSVNNIHVGVHKHITSKPVFQEMLNRLIVAHDKKNEELIEKSKSEITLFLKRYSIFASTDSRAVFDTNGRLLMSIGDFIPNMEIDKSSNSPFMSAIAGQYSILPPIDEPGTQKHRLFMALPIFDKEGKVIGVSIDGIHKDKNVYTNTRVYDFAKTGEAMVVDRYGDIISDTRFEVEDSLMDIYELDLEKTISGSIKYGQAGYYGKFEEIRDYRNQKVFTVISWNSEYGIGFVAKIDEYEVLEGYYDFRRSVYIVIAMMTIFTVPFTMFTLYVGKKSNEEVKASRHEIIARLGHAAEFKDNDTAKHIARISFYSEILANHLNMPKQWGKLLFNSSPMHDIGKIGVPDNILNKPGKLDADEWEIMKKHPEYGATIIGESNSPLLTMAREIALYHHEKWDGTGYPHGLSGTDIPLAARIVAVADVFDALTCDRVYKKAWTVGDATNLIMEESGKHFDPHVVNAFVKALPEFRTIRSKYADSV